jgi:hypothetical protein
MTAWHGLDACQLGNLIGKWQVSADKPHCGCSRMLKQTLLHHFLDVLVVAPR